MLYFSYQSSVVLNLLVSLFCYLIALCGRKRGNRQTDRQIGTPNEQSTVMCMLRVGGIPIHSTLHLPAHHSIYVMLKTLPSHSMLWSMTPMNTLDPHSML